MEQSKQKTNKNTLHQDDFIGSAIAIDSAQYIIQDLMEDFFDCFNPQDKEDQFRIVYEFPRYRAKANVLLMLLNEICKEFESNNVTVY